MCGGKQGSPWDTLGMSYVGQSCVGWWILLANLDITQFKQAKHTAKHTKLGGWKGGREEGRERGRQKRRNRTD